MKKYVSLFLAVIIFFSSFGTHAVYAESESEGMSQGRDDMQNMRSLTEEEEEQSEDDPQLEPESDTEAAVNDFTLEYNAAADVMILKYQVNHAVACVDILVDGRPAEVNYSNVYTSYSYDLPDDAEGKKYAFQIIPYEIQVLRYQNFSLQGQPRSDSPTLREIFALATISVGMAVGLAGYKYYEDANWFDVPEYIVQTLRDVVGHGSLVNFTRELTGLPNGLRMTIRSAEEIAAIHAQAGKVANVMRRMFARLEPGISELELSRAGHVDFAPQQTYSMVNFGAKSVSMGIKSPSPFVRLECGGPMSMAFSQRGSLMCRAALAAEDMRSVSPELRTSLEDHIMPYWSAVARWYEQLCVGCSCGRIYDQVFEIIGNPRFGFTLNPGHYIGGDEWVNTEFRHGSEVRIHSGSHIQCDIIAAASHPTVSAICEDTVVVADEGLRLELKSSYPKRYQAIVT